MYIQTTTCTMSLGRTHIHLELSKWFEVVACPGLYYLRLPFLGHVLKEGRERAVYDSWATLERTGEMNDAESRRAVLSF